MSSTLSNIFGAIHADHIVALFTFVLALFAFLLWRSTEKLWQASIDQGRFAQQAAHAALLSATVAEQSLKSTQRAFVLPREVKQTQVPGADHLLAALVWENAGTTPALSVRTHVCGNGRPDPLPDDFDFPDLNLESGAGGISYIGAKAAMVQQAVPIPHNVVGLVGEGKVHLYIWGWAEYDDIFATRHRTEFCYQVVAIPSGIPDAEGKHPVRIEFQHYRRFNGTDDSCLRQPAAATP